jgi:hypothetical protein
LTRDEAELVTNYRQLSAEDQSAVKRIVATMIGPKTMHAPKLAYKAADGG